MFIRHSFNNLLRSWPKSILFFLLLTALGSLLCIGVSMTAAILDFLRECDENYTTVAVFEYIGVDYPDETRFDPDIARCMETFDFDSLADDPAVLNWDRNDVALGSIAGKTAEAANPPYKYDMIVVIYILSYNEQIGAYQYSVIEDLVNPGADVTSGYLDTDMIELQVGHLYLMHASESIYGATIGQTRSVIITPFTNAAAAIAGVDASAGNMIADVSTGKGNYEIPKDNILGQLAETYAVVNAGVTVRATNDLDSLLPFQQSDLTIIKGRGFSQDEYGGAKVCVLPQRLAELIDAGPGEKISLSLAVQEGAAQRESYWAGTGFAYEDSYTVVGIFSPNDEYRDVVFIPKSASTDLSANKYSFTIGQARLKNARADRFYMDIAKTLPPRVRVTVYDQGYAAAAEPLQDVLRIAVMVTVVCALTTLAMLALFGFLFVYRQRDAARIMRRLGAANGGIFRYFLFGSGFIALLGAAGGAAISYRLSGAFMDLVRQAITRYGTDNLRYSNANFTVTKTMDFAPDIALAVFIMTALAVFVLAIAACFIFTSLSIRGNKSGGREKRAKGEDEREERQETGNDSVSSVHTSAREQTARAASERGRRSYRGGSTPKARSLSGGAAKYAWLSVLRGASRSALPFVLCALAASLILQLTSATAVYEESFDRLVTDTSISGYVTDSRGAWRYGLILPGTVVNDFYQSGLLSEVSVAKTGYHYAYGIDFPQVWNAYTTETYTNKLASGPGYIRTNDLASVQEFYGCAELPVTFIDGYDLSMFSYIPSDDDVINITLPMDGYLEWMSGLRSSLTPGLVSTVFLEDNGLAPGDEILVPMADGDGNREYVELIIVGSYIKQGSADNIYAPLYDYHYREFDAVYNPKDPDNPYIILRVVPASYVFSPEPDPESLQLLTFGSFSFKMEGAAGLEAFKTFLYDSGYSEVNNARSIRSFITIEDKTFLAAQRAMSQRLWYMQKIFPALYILLELLAALIPFILIQARKRESALMRIQGAAKHTAFFSVFWEQMILCIPGVLTGAGVWIAFSGAPTRQGFILILLFALFWLLGTGFSAFTLNRETVRTVLRAAE